MRNLQTSRANSWRIVRIKNAKFSGYCFYMNTSIQGDFQICINVPSIKSKIVFILQENDSHDLYFQKQPSRGVPRKRCSENMLQVYRKTSMLKCDFNKIEIPLRYIFTKHNPNQKCSIWLETSAGKNISEKIVLLHCFTVINFQPVLKINF